MRSGASSCRTLHDDDAPQCSTALPILCIRTDNSPSPAGLNPDLYHGWAKGNIATTQPLPGNWMSSQAAADQICAGA